VDPQQQSRWRRIGRQALWILGGLVAVSAAVFVINRFFVHHPLWDWLKLLIVPAVLAGGGLWFNAQQREREQQTAHNRAQDETLQAYLDGMAELLTDKDQPLHRAQQGDSLSTVARARTLTVLGRLDGGRKRSVLQFLYESGLIHTEEALLNESDLIEKRHNIVSLAPADLSEANLHKAILIRANLMGAHLIGANLMGANLMGADLSGAILFRTRMRGTDLSDANLRGAILVMADLRGVLEWTEDQLSTAKTLEGAIMPDGQTLGGYSNPGGPSLQEWIKSKGSGEDKESGPS
jgi:hypothetical protein